MKEKAIIIIFIIIFIITIPCITKAFSLDGIASGADDFLNMGGNTNTIIDEEIVGDISDILYNTLLGIAMVAAVIIGMILGIKYMTAGSEEKAKTKETLGPYFISCIVVFAAFTIWKLIVNILQ